MDIRIVIPQGWLAVRFCVGCNGRNVFSNVIEITFIEMQFESVVTEFKINFLVTGTIFAAIICIAKRIHLRKINKFHFVSFVNNIIGSKQNLFVVNRQCYWA